MHADGIAIDWISDKLYFHDWCYRHIGVLDLARNLQKNLTNNTYMYYRYQFNNDIVVDPVTRYIYFTFTF